MQRVCHAQNRSAEVHRPARISWVGIVLGLLMGLPMAAASEPEPVAPEAEARATASALERAYAQRPSPTLLLAIAEAHDAIPSHCEQSLAVYERFFEVCKDCDASSLGVTRFEQALERCRVSIDREVAIRRRLSVPTSKSPQRVAGDASQREVVNLLKRAKKIDPKGAVRLLLTLTEAGEKPDVRMLNDLRRKGWAILSRRNATPEQAREIVERIKKVDPAGHDRLVSRLDAANASDPDASTRELNAVRASAFEILEGKSSGLMPVKVSTASCRANDKREWGLLTVSTKPWSIVYINGRKVGETPVSKVDALAGCVTVRARDDKSGREVVKNVTVRPNRNAILAIDLESGTDKVRYE